MSKILFILPSLKAGGAERVISFIAQELVHESFEVTILIQGYSKDQFFKVDNAKLVFLEKPRLLSAILEIFLYIKRTRPNIVVGSISHVNQLLGFYSFFFPSISFIGRETNVGGVMNKFSKRHTPFFLKKILYSGLEKIICQSADMKEDFDKRFCFRHNKSIIVNNPITWSSTERTIFHKKRDKIRLITVGRLSKVKGHLRILEILKEVDFNFEYLIVGTGPLKEVIEEYIYSSDMNDKVRMIDNTKDVKRYLLESDFFIQGSFTEGFPNALLEAISLGIPCIAFDVPGGTREIIKNSSNGYIVTNSMEFKEALRIGIDRDWDYQKIKDDCNLRFGRDRIIDEYVQLFKTIQYGVPNK